MAVMSGESKVPGARYSTVSIVLHWLIAVVLIWQVTVGIRLDQLERTDPDREWVLALHFSIGWTILMLALIRLAWRLLNGAPPLPQSMPKWERISARITHAGFYVVLIGMPLTGWGMVSARPGPPPDVWWLLPWFDLPCYDAFPRGFLGGLHTNILLKLLWVLLALHIAGALKGWLIDRNEVLWRILPLRLFRGSRSST